MKRAKWLHPLKTLIIAGVKVVGGSDCPMEPLNPLLGIQEVVLRQVFPEQRLSVEEALKMYTLYAAFSSSEEAIKGSIEEGKLAFFYLFYFFFKSILVVFTGCFIALKTLLRVKVGFTMFAFMQSSCKSCAENSGVSTCGSVAANA